MIAKKTAKKRTRPKPCPPGVLPQVPAAAGRPLPSIVLDVLARAGRPVGVAELAKGLARRRGAVDGALQVLWRRGRISWTTTGDAVWIPPSTQPRTGYPIL